MTKSEKVQLEKRSEHGKDYFSFTNYFSHKKFVSTKTGKPLHKVGVFFSYRKNKDFPNCLKDVTKFTIEEKKDSDWREWDEAVILKQRPQK